MNPSYTVVIDAWLKITHQGKEVYDEVFRKKLLLPFVPRQGMRLSFSFNISLSLKDEPSYIFEYGEFWANGDCERFVPQGSTIEETVKDWQRYMKDAGFLNEMVSDCLFDSARASRCMPDQPSLAEAYLID